MNLNRRATGAGNGRNPQLVSQRGITPELEASVWEQESSGEHIDPDTGSIKRNPRTGAMGISQVMPLTGWSPGFGVEPLIDPSQEQQARLEELNNQRIAAMEAGNQSRVNQKTRQMRAIIEPLMEEVPEEEYRRFGREYLNAMIQRYGGSVDAALAAYNWGPGNVDKVITRAGREKRDWKELLPGETSRYIPQIKDRIGRRA